MRCQVTYATRQREQTFGVQLAAGASIAEALAAARAQAGEAGADIPWDTAPVGIFGELRQRGDSCADGDRIELYRALQRDPRERRRERVAHERRTPR
jgi:putative ubiquitin-RnfH superfamily antitoxin RatB of RatAB toxin-antitoxin module